MKKNCLILAILLSIVLDIQAQESNFGTFSAEIGVSAQVIPSIELITVNTVTFGTSQPGQTEIYVNPVNDLNAGYMIAVGTPEAEFRLNYLKERQLENTEGDGSLTFEYLLSGNDIEDQASSELFDDSSRSIQFNNDGRYFIWVGGRVDLSNAEPGNYEGDFTIEIDYI